MSEDIFIRKSGYIGHITLNRPDVLNSLTYSMILSIEKALIEWETDENIALIIIDAEGDRAFCAGGDIQILYENGFEKNFAYGKKFWADEYRLNERISNYKKPFVAFMQGFTMGGGVGVSKGTDSVLTLPPPISVVKSSNFRASLRFKSEVDALNGIDSVKLCSTSFLVGVSVLRVASSMFARSSLLA